MDARQLVYDEVAPRGPGACVSRAVWSLRGRAVADEGEPVVPDGCAEIVFNFADPFEERAPAGATRQPHMMLVGPTSRPIVVRPTGRIDIVGVRLEPWAVAAVCEVPAGELRDRTVPLDLLSPRLGALASRLGDAPAAGRRALLAAWLDREAANVAVSYNRARPLIEAIRGADRPPTVTELARRLGRSVRSVQRAFARDVGISPRTVFRIAKVQRALQLSRSAPARSWAWVAARAGYYDQSHLVRDFRELVGLLPSQYRPDAEGLTTAFVSER
jgi:AraC-like DNA-binding protein